MEVMNLIQERIDFLQQEIEKSNEEWQYHTSYEVHARTVDLHEDEIKHLQKILALLAEAEINGPVV